MRTRKARGGNDYQVEVEVSDGVNITTQIIDVSVTDVNDDAPVITSPNAASIAENTTAVLQVTATDTEPVTFALSGNGADDALFQIDGAGNLSFIAAPDFETPQGSGGNDYQVEVEVSDGVNTTTQTIDISVTDENDNAPVITSANTASVAENTTAVLQVTATDADTVGGPLAFALSGNGADDGLFEIDGAGNLSFLAAPDFENPQGSGGNDYQVEVEVSDGVNTTTQTIDVSVTDVNDDAPVITSANAASVAENTTAVLQVTATDADAVGGPLAFALSGNGADDGLFTIDGAGNLSFLAAPDFENPQGSSGNDYQVEVEVSDGVNTTTQIIDIAVTDENDNAPVITSPNTASVAENTTAVLQVTATDADTVGGPLTFALSGNGADDGLFQIDGAGNLSFLAAPDFENPLGSGGNDYQAEVEVSDGINTTTQIIGIAVTNVNDDAPVITSPDTASIAENTTAVLQVTATDTEPLTFALSGNGADDGLFTIDGAGNLSFLAAPDFENPQGSGANDYQVEVEVSDGVNTTTQTIDISVTDENDNAPVITSPIAASVAENTTAVLQVTATDADTVGGPLTFALSGNGADDGLFQIDGAGNLSFLAAPDFENPQGSGGNDYQVEVEVTDGVNTTTQIIDISVTDVNDDAPVITSPNAASIAENTTAVLQVTATDTEPVTFALSGNGADDALFQIDGAGNLSFIAAPDFETPQGSGGNDYQVEVEVSDGVNTTTQTIDISVTDENDNAPVITSANTASVAENTTAVLQVTATDADTVGGPLTFALSGNGADDGLFQIDGAGNLSFIAAPDFENPQGSSGNDYQVEVEVSDGVNTTTQIIDVSVTDVNDDAPVITSPNAASIAENTTAVLQVTATDTEPLTFSLSGNGADDGLFQIDGAGNLSFLAAPDFENPQGSGGNDYQVEVEVSDGVNTTTQIIDVSVTDENDNAPVITSPIAASVAENTTAVLQVTATDADTVGGPLTFALSGNGADDGLFQIDGAGNLSFLAAPDFENPQGSGGNDYQVEVEVSDGVNITTQIIDVSVTDVNDDAPVITSPNAASIAENTTAVLQVTATDTEPVTFALSGNGADDGLFQIDGAGNLSFLAAPDFENPQGSGGNDYQVEVEVSDGVNTTTQTIDISVTDENDNAPVITSPIAASVAENTTAVLQVTATDADTVGGPLTFALSGNGADDGLFQIDGAGNLSFLAAPDFENPQGSGGNDYQVEVEVTDGVNTTTQIISTSRSRM